MKIKMIFLIMALITVGVIELFKVETSHSQSKKELEVHKRIAPFPPDYTKRRVIVSTDIGGGDFDDVQSMIHFLLYLDMFDVEAIISSMPRPGNFYWKEILRAYRRDYVNLSFHSADYPTPRELKRLYKLGSTSKFPGNSNRGARQIVKAVLRDDPRPVYVLIWGSSTDLAIAIKILKNKCIRRKQCNYNEVSKKLRPFLIANYYKKEFNREGDEASYQYVLKQRKIKKIIVSDMGRGIYMGGLNGQGRYGNVGFVRKVILKHGRLGRLFHRRSATINVNKYGIKMGDTSSVFFAMNGNWDNLSQPTWAGKYCRVRKDVWTGCRDKKMGPYPGAGHINQHRRDYLDDFEKRLKRLDPIPE